AVTAAREAAGDRYVCILGADVARQCAAAGLLDEVLVFIVPVLLGDGTRLYDAPDGHPVGLGVREVTHAPTGTPLWHAVARCPGDRVTPPDVDLAIASPHQTSTRPLRHAVRGRPGHCVHRTQSPGQRRTT